MSKVFNIIALTLTIGLLLFVATILIFRPKAKNPIQLPKSKLTSVYPTKEFIDQQFPTIRLPTIEGVEIDIAQATGENRALVIFFSSFDCSSCLNEAEFWQTSYLRESTIQVFGITNDTIIPGVRRFMKLYKITFPILLDHENILFNVLKIQRTPTKVLIDEKMNIKKITNEVFLTEKKFTEFLELK